MIVGRLVEVFVWPNPRVVERMVATIGIRAVVIGVKIVLI